MIRGDSADQAVFTRAATLVRSHGIDADANLGALLDQPPANADADVLQRLQHMYESAAWVLMESAIADLPADLRWLFESGAVTVEQLAALHQALDVTSAGGLAAAVSDHAIRDVEGLNGSIEDAIAAALPGLRRAVPRIALGRAVTLARPILKRLRSTPGVIWARPAGSLRRGQDTVGDIEIVAATANPANAIAELLRLPDVVRHPHRSDRRLYLRVERVQVGVRLPEPSHAGATLLQATGSGAHLTALRAHAHTTRWRLTRDGLRSVDGTLRPAATEEEIYAALDLPFVPPEIRNGEEEIQAAKNGVLPTLLSMADIHGDLHMHTDFSDGRDTVDAMVQACRGLGYEYVAITDHSPHSAASRNLSVESIARQAEEIARLRDQYPDIAILHGCEVDILPDGRLDFPDRVLERLDIVLASLHERAGQSGEHLLRRYSAAMKHPLVTLITHPTNRLVPHRPGYDLDYDALFEMAVETRTIVEIDGSPAHLDLDGALSRRAIAAGATMAVNSDCHRAELLEMQIELGVTTARRGWVERRHVVNTRPLDEIRAVIAAKREG
ncbi:MAG: PHP domain-containing protein [Acidobacteria bacterium]|nr:PHP domain-containing protein [Acidobacteriota bacterium]